MRQETQAASGIPGNQPSSKQQAVFDAVMARIKDGYYATVGDYDQLMKLVKFLIDKKLIDCEEAAALSAAAHEFRTGPYLTRVKPPAR